jgi:4-hydroxymandelate synthase
MNIDAIDHLEFYVEDIERSAFELRQAFGFHASGSGGPETGLPGCRSLLLRQQDGTSNIKALYEAVDRQQAVTKR